MKSIFRPFKFYREDELESKWWHRLIKVLIYGSTIAVFIICISSFIDDINSWNNPDPKYIYSFEPKYSETFGFSRDCTFNSENNENILFVDCGNVNKKSYNGTYYFLPDFLDRYAKSNSYKEEFLIKNSNCLPVSSDSILRIKPFCYETLTTNYKLLNQRIEEGKFDNIQAKRIILIIPLVVNTTLTFIVPILWFFLLKLVIYRSFVYIILGKKK